MEVIAGELGEQIAAVLEEVNDPVVIMATVSAMVFVDDARFDWVGFYRNRGDDNLIIGPYQGVLGCLVIPFSKGVCGHVATSRVAINVPDVDQFPGHIACATTTRSEIVLPVSNAQGEFLAVLDIDSNQENAFSQADLDRLQSILDIVFAKISLASIQSSM